MRTHQSLSRLQFQSFTVSTHSGGAGAVNEPNARRDETQQAEGEERILTLRRARETVPRRPHSGTYERAGLRSPPPSTGPLAEGRGERGGGGDPCD